MSLFVSKTRPPEPVQQRKTGNCESFKVLRFGESINLLNRRLEMVRYADIWALGGVELKTHFIKIF